MSSNNAKNLRFRYKQGMEVGHKTFLRLLRCQGYIITVTKDSSPEVIEKILRKWKNDIKRTGQIG